MKEPRLEEIGALFYLRVSALFALGVINLDRLFY